jgi:hypothetical protein
MHCADKYVIWTPDMNQNYSDMMRLGLYDENFSFVCNINLYPTNVENWASS